MGLAQSVGSPAKLQVGRYPRLSPETRAKASFARSHGDAAATAAATTVRRPHLGWPGSALFAWLAPHINYAWDPGVATQTDPLCGIFICGGEELSLSAAFIIGTRIKYRVSA